MELPSLSVIVPNYNHARSLPACLEAILAQSVPPLEVIVIDDGSTDDSLRVMEAFASRDPRVRVHRNEANRGVVFTMNRGTALARGEFLHFASADDIVLPGLFEESLALLAENRGAALSCTISRWRDAATGVEWLMGAGMSERPAYFSPDELVELERRGRLMIVSHSSLLRAEVVRELGGFRPELRWHCDWWVTYAGAFRHGLCHVPRVLSEVHLHGSSYYGSGHRRGEHDEVMDRLLDLLRAKANRDVAERIRRSGALALHSTPMLRAMLRSPGGREFLTPLFLRKCLWRRAQVLGRRHLPAWLARWCVRVLGMARPPGRPRGGHPAGA